MPDQAATTATTGERSLDASSLGGPASYNHYAVGWAHALSTPYQWTKQVASHRLAGHHDYGTDNTFSGQIKWVQLDLDVDDYDYLISPQERFRFARARQ